MARNITTIELKRDTHNKLNNLRNRGHSFDDVITALINDNKEIEKHIQRYIIGAHGKCITKVILGHAVVANHSFDCNGVCKKCGTVSPIDIDTKDNVTTISIGNDDSNDINVNNHYSSGDALQTAKEKLPDGGIIKFAKGEYNFRGNVV